MIVSEFRDLSIYNEKIFSSRITLHRCHSNYYNYYMLYI